MFRPPHDTEAVNEGRNIPPTTTISVNSPFTLNVSYSFPVFSSMMVTLHPGYSGATPRTRNAESQPVTDSDIAIKMLFLTTDLVRHNSVLDRHSN